MLKEVLENALAIIIIFPSVALSIAVSLALGMNVFEKLRRRP